MITPCSTLVRPHLQEQLQFGASYLRGINQSTHKMMKKKRGQGGMAGKTKNNPTGKREDLEGITVHYNTQPVTQIAK